MKSKLLITMVAIATLLFVSCKKEEITIKEKEDSFLISEVDSIIDKTNNLKSSSSQWGSYPLLSSTGNSAKYFNTGTYAVKITRSWWNGTLKFSGVFQADGNISGKVSTFLYDKNWNLISTTSSNITAGQIGTFARIPIEGSNQLIIVFTAYNSGYYSTWYYSL